MRIDMQSQSINKVASPKIAESQLVESDDIGEQNTLSPEINSEITTDKMQQVVDSINEIFEINNSELKFVFHDGLKEYYVQLVNSETEEVVREIPSKKLLDVFYEMQKLVGMIVDEKI